jgi:hypothetical protein
MNFLNRLKFYLVGFILGLFLVYSLFKNREWDWLPKNKIKKFLLTNPIKINIEKSEVLNINEDFSKKVFDVIINGNILFSKSETKTNIKNYFLESNNDTISIDISFDDSTCRITSINDQNFTRNKSISHIDTNIYMDNFNFYKVLEKFEKKYSKEVTRDLENYQLNELDIEKNLKTININWVKSNGFKIANPFYRGRINIQELDYEIYMEKGNKKIRFKRLKKIIHQEIILL